MVKLNKNYPQYIDILTENDYILALPSNDILYHCTIDQIFISEHILQPSYDGKELVSLNMKTYTIKDKKLVLATNANIDIDIISTDVCYAENSGKNFKRM